MTSIVKIDDIKSDPTLVLDKPNDDGHADVLVSSHVMRRASPVWRSMLAPSRWKESSEARLPMPENDLDAMTVVLHIAHLNFMEVPTSIGEIRDSTLLQIAILCDKYDLFNLVSPWIDHWIGKVDPELDVADMLFVFYVFNRKERFVKLANSVVPTLRCVLNAEDGMENQDGRNMVPQGQEHRNNVMTKLMGVRKSYVQTLLAVARKQLSSAKKGACKAPSDVFSWECNTLLHGSCRSSLKDIKLYEYVKTSSTDAIPHDSVNEVLPRMRLMKAVAHGYYDNDCTSWDDLRKMEGRQNSHGRVTKEKSATVESHADCEQSFHKKTQNAIDGAMKDLPVMISKAFEDRWRSGTPDSRNSRALCLR